MPAAHAWSEKDLARELKRLEREMLECARNLEFERAAKLSDELRGSEGKGIRRERITLTEQRDWRITIPSALFHKAPLFARLDLNQLLLFHR